MSRRFQVGETHPDAAPADLYAGSVPAEMRRRRVFTACPRYSTASGRVRYWWGVWSSLDVAKVGSVG